MEILGYIVTAVFVALVLSVIDRKRALAQGAGGTGATQRPVPPPSWQDFAIPGTSLGAFFTSPDIEDFDPPGGILPSGMKVYAFRGSGPAQELFGEFELEHSYEEGTDIHPHVHWVPSTSAAGNVRWFIEYSVCNVGETYPVGTTISEVTPTDEVAYKSMFSSLPAISGEGLKIGAQVVFRLYRDSSDPEDTYEADALLLTVGFHFRQDTVGSRSIAAK